VQAAMLISLDQFVNSLANSGIIDPEEFSQFLENLPANTRFSDAKTLAHELQRRELLTFFQAREALKGKAKGLVFGPYIVLDLIGGGGMGCVYKARHRQTNKIVALKTLSPVFAETPEAVQRFQREVETCKRLKHPNIVTLVEGGQANGAPFLVMEYIEGRDLNSLVKLAGPLTLDQSVSCLLQAASGLQYAHEQGVIHRDVKPSNLLLDQQGVVRVADLGLARLLPLPEEEGQALPGRLTRPEQILGTPEYMSPEQARDPRFADARSDIYSLGCAWHFLLTAKPPYAGKSSVDKLLAHRERPIPSLRARRPNIPESVDSVFQKMLAKRPDERFASMAEVICALEASASAHEGVASAEWADSTLAPSAKLGPATPECSSESPTMAAPSDAATIAYRPDQILSPPAATPDFAQPDAPRPPAGRRMLLVAVMLVCLIALLVAVAAFLAR
jgi:serine/threonine protein kinase